MTYCSISIARGRPSSSSADAREVFERRLRNARSEMGEMFWYDDLVINDDFELAKQQLQAIIVAAGCRTEALKERVRQLFGELAR